MTKVFMKDVMVSGNHRRGAIFHDIESLHVEGGEFSGNGMDGLTVRNTVIIPEDMASAIRAAVADGQTPEQVGSTYGEALAKLGVPIANILAVAANGAQLLQYLGINL